MPSPLAVSLDPVGAALQQTFISFPPGSKTSSDFVAFRKTVRMPSSSSSAMLHIFADARYVLSVNGESVLRGPSRFETRGPEYDTLDIAPWLQDGDNQLTVLVMGFPSGTNARMMRHAPGLTLRLEADGRTLLQTDSTWRWSDQTRYRTASIDWAHIKDRIDMRVENGDWTQPDYNDAAWKPSAPVSGDQWGPLTARRIPLLRDTPVFPKFKEDRKLPVTLRAGEQMDFKMDRLVQAYTALEIEGEEGSELTLDHAKIEFIARAGRQTYVSSDSFAFEGGAIKVKSGQVTIRSLRFFERLYPFDVVGSFVSSDEMLNRLWAVCARSLQVLSEDAYVDCADRERAEWMDDDPPAFDITRTAMAGPGAGGKPHYADPRLLEALIRRTALTVQPAGWVKAHTCSDRFDIHAHMEDRSCDWVQGARRYFDSTGNAAVIREIWPVIVRQLEYFLQRRTERGLVRAREWVVWGNPVGYVTCEGAGLNAFVYKALVDAAYLGDGIGERQQAASFALAAKDLSKAYNDVLWDKKTGSYFSGYYSEADRAKAEGRGKEMKLKVENNLIEPTLFSCLWALDQGLVPAERKTPTMEYLLANRTQADRVMTFYYLFCQLYHLDTPEFDREVLEILRKKWKGMAFSGGQTTWEEFSGGSRAHCYGMFPGYFLSAYVLGVRPELPTSQKRILIEPHLGDLSSAEGNVVTEFGLVPISWKNAGRKLSFSFEIPQGVSAQLRLPTGTLILNGLATAGKSDGHRIVAEVASGKHQGSVLLP